MAMLSRMELSIPEEPVASQSRGSCVLRPRKRSYPFENVGRFFFEKPFRRLRRGACSHPRTGRNTALV